MKKNLSILIAALACLAAIDTAAQGLSAVKANEAADAVKADWLRKKKAQYEGVAENKCLQIGDLAMPFKYIQYGTAPADGFSLFISLHGGGAAPAEVNDQQWNNQVMLYRSDNGIFLSPRAPYNDWDMWFKPALDEFYHELIEMAVSVMGVNPDKVYIMGYSAGGDGVWRMATRMADTWAAASMMAGHPGDVSLLNLRNLPFMNWCGEFDYAYKRNRENLERGVELDSLQLVDPEGYTHETHIVRGKGHWMDRVDSAAVKWMEPFSRNPYPKKIVWRQEEVVRPHFYWLSAPKDELERGRTVRLELSGNKVEITQCDYSALTLYFNDEMVNLDESIEIRYKDKVLFSGRLNRTKENLSRTLQERGDYRYMFPAAVNVSVR